LKEPVMVKLERWVIILISLHSFGIGIGLLWSPSWAFRMAGWEEVTPLFFPHQAGAFHIVVACGYLIEYFRYRGILILLTAKGIATVFLLASAALGEHSWVVMLSGIADALMGLVAFFLHRQVVKLGLERQP
jgi:hypothetical protein